MPALPGISAPVRENRGMGEELRPVVLADRDGTLIRDIPYLDRIESIELLPGVARSIRLLNERGIPVAIVTNQSGVARGIFPESFVLQCHARLMSLLAEEGATVQGIYYCPHLETTTGKDGGKGDSGLLSRYTLSCTCRKPAPGLLLRALADFRGDPARSAMIGDADRDMEAGVSAGCLYDYRIDGSGREETGPGGGGGTFPKAFRIVRSFEEGVHRFLGTLDKGANRRKDSGPGHRGSREHV